MAEHGGYRRPSHPAPVSGPGALSRRTDGGPTNPQPQRQLPDAQYGEQQAFHDAQAAAPMASAPAPAIIPLDAPSQRPGEPVTSGAAAGPGPGPLSSGLQPSLPQADFQRMKSLLPGLEVIASMPSSNPSTRAFYRQLRALGTGQ